ncbi:unnamed protein product [Oikopleura dioica]|uniref:Uncharacterized protein n=1 Tax=Oikopleura dioica TaxID=34765 RepID=E4Y645_OIKDI|nr:unnamed protein product [Oikopleura dioica]
MTHRVQSSRVQIHFLEASSKTDKFLEKKTEKQSRKKTNEEFLRKIL